MRVHDRMAAARLVDGAVAQRRDVVRAQQAERPGVGEGDVEQRLVQLALDELGGAATGPDGLADPAQRPLRVLVDEVPPGGDDAPGVAAEHRHVRELHGVRVGAEGRLQARDLLRADGDEHRLAGSMPSRRNGSVPATKPSTPS